MATTLKTLYGTNGQTITLTIASLASTSARASTAVDNTTNLFLDALVQLIAKTNAAGTSATGYISIYAYGTADGGTTYSDGATGTDAGITLTSVPNATLIGVLNCVANATTYKSPPFSVAAAFGGQLPDHWGIIIVNSTGAALDSTAGSHSIKYQGIQVQNV